MSMTVAELVQDEGNACADSGEIELPQSVLSRLGHFFSKTMRTLFAKPMPNPEIEDPLDSLR